MWKQHQSMDRITLVNHIRRPKVEKYPQTFSYNSTRYTSNNHMQHRNYFSSSRVFFPPVSDNQQRICKKKDSISFQNDIFMLTLVLHLKLMTEPSFWPFGSKYSTEDPADLNLLLLSYSPISLRTSPM